MKKKIYVTLLVTLSILMSISVSAQSVLIVGDGSTSTMYPPASKYFNYAWSTIMYTSSEMGTAKAITKIAFDQTVNYSGYWQYAILQNQKIYMKQTSDTELNSLAYEDPTNPANGYTLVFDGEIQFNLNWTEITLNSTFNYDGTSNLIVHWENHRGPSSPAHVSLLFNSTTVTQNLCKTNTSDASFPTDFGEYNTDRPNIEFFYQSNGPATPLNPTPTTETIKTDLETSLDFDLGANTTTFDLLLDTKNPPTNYLINDQAIASPGRVSVNPSIINAALLSSKTKYFWKVIAKNSSESSESEVWSFTTQDLIIPPFSTSFEDSIINNSNVDSTDWSWPTTGPANWRSNTIDAFSGSHSVMCNAWSADTGSYSLTTPRIKLNGNQRVIYRWKQNNYSGSPKSTTKFEITDDGGVTWKTLNTYSPNPAMTDFEQETIELSSYSGDNIYLRWTYTTQTPYVSDNFYIDDFSIEDIPNTAVSQLDIKQVDFPELFINGVTKLKFPIKNIGGSDLKITGITSSGPFTFEWPEVIAVDATDYITATFHGTSTGTFTPQITLEGDFEGDKTVNLSGTVISNYEDLFENFDVSNEIPMHWNIIRTSLPNDEFTTVRIKSSTYDAFSQPNAAKMQKLNDTISPLMFVTPGVTNFDNHILQFRAKKGAPDYEVNLSVGVTDNPYDSTNFELVKEISITGDYQLFEVNFDSANTKPYIVFRYDNGNFANSIWIDDVSWETIVPEKPNCADFVFPDNSANNVDIMSGLKLQWTSGSGNTNGYKLSFGTDPNASNIINSMSTTSIEYSFNPEELDYNTTYYWKVIAYNEQGDAESCDTWTFTTMSDPTIETFPYTQNFDQVTQTAGFDFPLGWSVDNNNNDNFTWDIITNSTTPDLAYSAPNAMHMVFALHNMDDWLFTSPIKFKSSKKYFITFMYRTVGDQYVPNPTDKLQLSVKTKNNASAQEIKSLIDLPEITNQTWQMAQTYYTPSTDETSFLGFHGYSEPNQGILIIDNLKIEEQEGTSINETQNNLISVYPNPAKNTVNITCKGNNANYKLLNICGKTIKSGSLEEGITNINLSDVKVGVYLIEVNINNVTTTTKLIKL